MNEQKRDALAEALHEGGWQWRANGRDEWRWSRASLREQKVAYAKADALLPLVDTWLAEAEQRVADAVEAALKLIAPDHITPMGARQVKKAMEKAEGER